MTSLNSSAADNAPSESMAAEERLATPEGRKDFWRATFSCWLGTAMEYADFALYGLAAGIIFGDVFFPEATPAIALLSSFATYSVGFIARPIGALLFGRLGDRKGRKVVMITTISLMGASTTMIGLIPSYASIGLWAPACLAFLRFMQGLGAGAELSGGAVMLGEIDELTQSHEGRSIVEGIINLGHALSMTVTAEGVETTEQLEHLQTLMCDEAQGYLLGKPMKLSELLNITHQAGYSE